MEAHRPLQVSFNPFLFVLIPSLLLSFSTGDSKSEYIIPIRAESVYTNDIDLDGDRDIIIGHLTNLIDTNTAITLLKNTGDGYFEIFDTSQSFLGYQWDIFSALINNDEYPDIVARYYQIEKSKAASFIRIIYMNENGIENFLDFNIMNSEFSFDASNYGDINGDGFNDILIAGANSDSWGVLYNDGNGNLTEPEYFSADYPLDIKCGNLNNDIYDDIVVAGGPVKIILPNGSGFEEILFNGYNEVFIVDFDLDGDNDIFEINMFYPFNFFSFLENLGNNDFFQHPDTTTHPGGHHFFVSDLNNDNYSDILYVANNMNGVCIYYNKGGFHLSDPVYVPITYYGEDHRNIYCDDMDGNGYNDIIIIRVHGTSLPANLVILFNDGNGNFVENPITNVEKLKQKDQNPVTCYPNPFSGLTHIWFKLAEESNVSVSIYDNTGREISRINSGLLSTGNHSVEFNSINLSSGIYFYSLEVNGTKTDTKKMTLMR